MATTMGPGTNSDEQFYRVESMSPREIEAFYRRCLGPADTSGAFTESFTGQGAAASATRTYAVQREPGVSVVRVRCDRCY
jgi:hypothetical protein